MRYDILYLEKGEDIKAFETTDLSEAYAKLSELKSKGYKGVHIQTAIPDAFKTGGILENHIVYSDTEKEIRLIGGSEVYYQKKDNYWQQLPLTEQDLKQGISVEMEHKNTLKSLNKDAKFSAKLIALDHLIEDKDYYKKLSKIEKMGFDNGGQINESETFYTRTYADGTLIKYSVDEYEKNIYPGLTEPKVNTLDQKNLRKYAENLLQGFNYYYVGYSDTNGQSMYFNVDGIKVRFSDHSVTNKDRMENEVHFDIQKIGSDIQKFRIEQSLLNLRYKLGDSSIKFGKREMLMPSGKYLMAYGFIDSKTNEYFNEGGVTNQTTMENKIRNIDIFFGKKIDLSMPNDEKRKGAYAIVELDDILASHNENTFENTIGYPVDSKGDNINDRNYTGDKTAQGKVIEYAQKLDPFRLITTSRTPAGSPIIDENGFVVSGNNRTMSLKLAKQIYPEKYKEYKDALKEEIESFGFESATMDADEFNVTNKDGVSRQFKNPVFVRVDFDIPALNQLELSKYNKDTKKAEKPIDKSIKLSKILLNQPACKESIGTIVGNYETFSEFYANYSDCKQVVDTLVGCNILSTQELPAYFSERGFTEQGKDLLENTLMGLVLDKQALIIIDEIRKLRGMLVTCLPVLSLNSTLGEFNLMPEINEAILLENTIKSSKLNFKEWIKTYGLFDEKPNVNIVIMNRFLQLGRNTFKSKLEAYNNSAKQNSGDSLFGEQLSKQDLFDNFVKGSIPEDELKLIESVYQQLQEEQKQPEVTNMSSINLFVGGEWYKNNPTKILAVTQSETSRYGKQIQTYKGSIDNVDRIDADVNIVILQQQSNPLLSDIPKDAKELTDKDTQQLENIKKAIGSSDKEIKKKRGRKNKIDAEKNTIATSSGQAIETRTLEEVYREINPEITQEDLQCFLWFNQNYGKEVKNSQWYELANTTMANLSNLSNAQLGKWIEQGVAFWNGIENRVEPNYLYLSGDVYAKYNRLVIKEGMESGEKDIDFIKNTFGESALIKQITEIELLFKKQYENRLIINSDDPNGLVLLPNSKFSKSFYINTLADEMPFKWKKITAQSDKRYGQFDFLTSKYLTESDKKELDKLNLQNAFCYWLRTDTTAGIKKGLTYADIINYYIFAKPKPKTVAEKEYDGTYSEASKKIIKEENAIFERLKAKTKQEGDRLFTIFLDKHLLFTDKVRLELEWNMRYNNNVPINYNKIPVGFRMNKFIQGNPLDVRPEKREAVAFTIGNGSGLLAYDVGVGKTPSAIFTVSAFIDLGWSKRPLIVVPNQTYKQWISEFKNFAGHLKINKMYNLSDTIIEDFQDSNGVTLQVAEQSVTIMTYEGLFALGFNEETGKSLDKELFSILIQEAKTGASDKDIQRLALKTGTKVQEVLGKALRQTKLNIEDLGIDYICIDEAHACKKVFTFVAGSTSENTGTSDKTSRAVAEYQISAGSPAYIALKGFALCTYVQTKYQGNTQLLTATPFTNSPLEIYSMLAMVSYNTLQKLGLSNLKEFFDTFIKISYEIVINTALNPVRKQIVLGFNNLLVLQRIIKQFINHKTGESVGVQRPKKYVLPYKKALKDGVYVTLPEKEQVDTAIPLTRMQAEFMNLIKQYAEGTINKDQLAFMSRDIATSFRTGNLEQKEYIEQDLEVDTNEVDIEEDTLDENEKAGVRLLLSLNHSRNLALSPYLYQFSFLPRPTPTEYIETSGKLTYVIECIRSIKKHHERTGTKMSGVVIYMERGTDFFELVRDYLISNVGFNPNEVGIISAKIKMPIERGIKDEDAKEYVKNLFLGKRFNKNTLELESIPDEERLKVLIGSSTIKEGINLQTYSSTLFNCFLAWNPTDIQQLEGRIYRQGNHFKNVRIVNPLMIDSADIFMFQKLEEKTARINSTFETDGKTNVLNTEELNPKDLKYSLIKNPYVIAQLEIQEVTESMNEKISDFKNDQKRVQEYSSNLSNLNYRLKDLNELIETYRPSYLDKTIDAKLKAMVSYFNTKLDENGKYTVEKKYGYDKYRNWGYTYEEPPKGKEKSPLEYTSKPSWFQGIQDTNRKILRFEKDFLVPRGLMPGADSVKIILDNLSAEIKVTEEEIKALSSKEALEQRIREIEIKRAELQIVEKSLPELIREFERLNYLLDDVKLPEVNKPVALSCPPVDANGVPRIDPEGLNLLNECAKNEPSTKFLNSIESKNEDGSVKYTYTPERQKLHKAIIDELTDNAVCIEQDKPIAVIMGGAPGSGKSTFLRTNAPYMQSDQIWKVDADEVRSFLPEYKGWNSASTHEEAKDIVNELLDSFDRPCKHDLLYDGTMSNVKKYQPIIKRLKQLGYQTFLVFMDIPKEQSIERALKRYQNNRDSKTPFGRYVPISVIEEFFSVGDKAFQMLKDSVDGYIKVDSLTQKVVERGGKQIPEERPYYKLTQPTEIQTKSEEKEVTLDELKITLSGAKTSLQYLSGQDKIDMENFIKGLETVIKYK